MFPERKGVVDPLTVKRVVVTGIGAVTPLGNSFIDSWDAAKKSISGIRPVTRFDVSDIPWKVAGELKGFSPEEYIPRKDLRRLDLFVHYAFAAAWMAFKDAALDKKHLNSAGVIIGSSRGGISTIEETLRKRPTAYAMSATTISMAASYIAKRLGIKGHCLGISNACSSGASAIGEAFRLIKHGQAEVVLAGGTEAPVCRLCIEGYGASGALSKKGISMPFDKKRDGFVLSEGASVLVLEDYESAIKRGARLYGEILGYGNTSDAFHQTVPDKKGQAKAIKAALEEAGIKPDDVDFINAHATSTPIGDITEAEAIELVFGKTTIPVSSVKSMTGHMLGASGAFEAGMTLMTINEGIIPPTVNLKEPEGGLNYVRQTRKARVRVAVSNSFGFGGVNSVLVFASVSD
jgi:3-oxoacyl-[acyl-carrier-protein] synthase II